MPSTSSRGAPQTIGSAFLRTVERRRSALALRRVGGAGELTWDQYARQAGRLAAGLRSLGLERGERVALLMSNRPEFHIADMGILLAGGTPVSLYSSSSPEQIHFVLDHCEATIIFVENTTYLERLADASLDKANLRAIVMVEQAAHGPARLSFGKLLDNEPMDLTARAASIAPEDVVTIIYTSGTTGDPKGVVLTHRNVCCAVDMYLRRLGRSLSGAQTISYLPMAHIAERVATHYLHVSQGTLVTSCDDLTKLPAGLREVRPEWFFAAPRLWEKLAASIEGTLVSDPDLRGALDRARAVGREVFRYRNDQRPLPSRVERQWNDMCRQTVKPILARIGLERARIANSGAAPMPLHVAELFLDLGVPLSDVYGQSETTGAVTWDPHRIVPGTSGKPLPGTELELAADGEILVRGPSVFAGYLKDSERTADVLDGNGWVHTGDVGQLDSSGNLRIVDRKKELIVTAGGKNVSPARLEAALRESPLIAHACVVGDGRATIAALIVLDPEAAPAWARSRGIPESPFEALGRHPAVRAEITATVETVNRRFARAEQVRAFEILDDAWRPDSPVLTPTAKLKRREILARYAPAIEALYQNSATRA